MTDESATRRRFPRLTAYLDEDRGSGRGGLPFRQIDGPAGGGDHRPVGEAPIRQHHRPGASGLRLSHRVQQLPGPSHLSLRRTERLGDHRQLPGMDRCPAHKAGPAPHRAGLGQPGQVGDVGARLLPRTGPRPLAVVGVAAAAGSMVLMTRFSTATVYWPDVLVPLLVGGLGLGPAFTAAMGTATLGVESRDAGVGSSLINTAQQIGGSVGVALLSTQATTAGNDYVTEHLTGPRPTPQLLADASIASYHTAFWWAAGFFLVGALTSLLLIPVRRPAATVDSGQTPATRH